MSLIIRGIENHEYPMLEEFLYQAIFVPEGVSPPSRSILRDPNISIYIENFGKSQDDYCLVAVKEKKIIGAVWARVIEDYGHIDKSTPSISISILNDYRGMGVGTELMKKIILDLNKKGYNKVSLSVQKANFAIKMYKKLGFKVFKENEEDFIMFYEFDNS